MSDPNDPYSGGAVPPPPPPGGAVPPPPAPGYPQQPQAYPPQPEYPQQPPAPQGYPQQPQAPQGYPQQPQQGYAPQPQPGYQAPPPGGGYPPAGGSPSSGPIYVPEVGANLAEPLTRVLAALIDGVILMIPYWILFGIAYAIFSDSETVFGVEVNTGMGYFGYLIVSILGAAIAFGYQFLLMSKDGTTIGKKVMKCRVVRADGQPLDQQSIMIRAGVFASPWLLGQLIPILGGILSFVIAVASLVLLFTDKRRETVADKAAKTLVIATQ